MLQPLNIRVEIAKARARSNTQQLPRLIAIWPWRGVIVSLVMATGLLSCPRVLFGVEPDSNLWRNDYYNIGDFRSPTSATDARAQRWYNRGMAMSFGFNHEEAVRCFKRAIQADPAMPMAYWGAAYALGPNINNLEIEPHQIAAAHSLIELAQLHATRGSQVEQDLINALSQRYVVPVPEDRTPLNRAYARAMRDLHQSHPDDPRVAALFAESLMILRPWKHWTPEGEPAEETPEIVSVLESALKRAPKHPALCHLYIHVMEASPTPEAAVEAADVLRNRMPGLGHLIHMPSHIDVRLGNYAKVIEANERAIQADRLFLEQEGPFNFYTLYRIHNYHFLAYGAMFDGQSQLAMKAARKLVDQVPEEMLRAQTDYLDAFMPMPLHVMIRFGRWDEILDEPQPAQFLPMSRAIWHYARGIAYAATDRIELAEKEIPAFHTEKARVPESSILFNNTSRDILDVAEAMLLGEAAYRKGDFDEAFRQLRLAVERDDDLNYDEPWGWMQPARHALGALLLEQGKVAEAEKVFRIDLERHPNNPWALRGLAESLDRLGKSQLAKNYHAQFTKACKRADVAIDRSCYCRLTTQEP